MKSILKRFAKPKLSIVVEVWIGFAWRRHRRGIFSSVDKRCRIAFSNTHGSGVFVYHLEYSKLESFEILFASRKVLMATELQSINYITRHIERLPLNDNNFVGTAEKLPSLLYYHESLERNSKSYKINKNGVQIRDNSTNRSSFEPRPGFNEYSKTWRDITHDSRPKLTRTIRDVVNKIDPILPSDDASACSKPHDEWSNLSVTNRNCDFTTNKRKRSSDSTGSDSSKSSCDEEIRRLGLCENRTLHSIPIQVQPDFYRPCDNLAEVSSSLYKKKPVCKSQPEQKRPKNRPALDLDSPKKRASSSTSWFPFRFRSGERKIKLIRVTPLDQRGPSIDNFYGEHLREEAFFRPIRVEEE